MVLDTPNRLSFPAIPDFSTRKEPYFNFASSTSLAATASWLRMLTNIGRWIMKVEAAMVYRKKPKPSPFHQRALEISFAPVKLDLGKRSEH